MQELANVLVNDQRQAEQEEFARRAMLRQRKMQFGIIAALADSAIGDVELRGLTCDKRTAMVIVHSVLTNVAYFEQLAATPVSLSA